MRTLRPALLSLLLAAATGPLAAQEAPRLSGQFLFGLAHRSPDNFSSIGSNGLLLLSRGGYRLGSGVNLIGEVSVTRFSGGGDMLAVPILCLPGVLCSQQFTRPQQVAAAGMSVGLQPHLELGGLRLMAGATLGGYWLYRHESGMPGAAPGFRGSLGLGLPIGGRWHILLEASALHMLRSGLSGANARNIGIGVGVN